MDALARMVRFFMPFALWLFVFLCDYVTDAGDMPRMQIRYNSSFLDVPLGYHPYPFRTEIWYRYVKICSDLVINIDLTNMGQGDQAVIVEISNCYMCDGASIKIIGWGSSTYANEVPASFSRPVHINISNNIMNSVLVEGAIHVLGVLPARSTVVIENNTVVQIFTQSTTSYIQSFILLEGLLLRDKSQFIIRGNTWSCSLPMTASDPTSTCYGIHVKEGLRVDLASSMTVTQNQLTLGAHRMYAIGVERSTSVAGAGLRLLYYSLMTISSNTFDLSTTAASTASAAPKYAIGVWLALDSIALTTLCSLQSMSNTFKLPSAATVNAGWYFIGPNGALSVSLSDRSLALFVSDVVTLKGGGSLGYDGYMATDTTASMSIQTTSAIVMESSTVTANSGGASTGSMSFITFGGSVTLGANTALWIYSNTIAFTAAAGSSFAFLNTARVTNIVSGSGFVVRENTCTTCNVFYQGGIAGANAAATVSAMVERCNTFNGVTTTTTSLFTITSLTSYACGVTCLIGADCFAATTTSAIVSGTTCTCNCDASTSAFPTYGGKCLPGGRPAMSIPLMFSSTKTLTEKDSVTETLSESTTETPSISFSASISQQQSVSQRSLTPSATRTPSTTNSRSPTWSPSPTLTLSETPTQSPDPPTATPSTTFAQSKSESSSASESFVQTRSVSQSTTESLQRSHSSSSSVSPSASSEPTRSVSQSSSFSVSFSRSASATASNSDSSTYTTTVTQQLSKTVTLTSQQTLTETFVITLSDTGNASVTTSITKNTDSGSEDRTLTSTYSESEEDSETVTMSKTITLSKTVTKTSVISPSITRRFTPSRQTISISPTETVESTFTLSLTLDRTDTATPSSELASMSMSDTATFSQSQNTTFSATTTKTRSTTRSFTRVVSPSPTGDVSQSVTDEVTVSETISTTRSPTQNLGSATQTNSSAISLTASETSTWHKTLSAPTSDVSSSPSFSNTFVDMSLTRWRTRSSSNSRRSVTDLASTSFSSSVSSTLRLIRDSKSHMRSSSASGTLRFTTTEMITVSPSRQPISLTPYLLGNASVTMHTPTQTRTVTMSSTRSRVLTVTLDDNITRTATVTSTLSETHSASLIQTVSQMVTISDSHRSRTASPSSSLNTTVTRTFTEMASRSRSASSSLSGRTHTMNMSHSMSTSHMTLTMERTVTLSNSTGLSVSGGTVSNQITLGSLTGSDEITMPFTFTHTRTVSMRQSHQKLHFEGPGGETLSLSLTRSHSQGTLARMWRRTAWVLSSTHTIPDSETRRLSPSVNATKELNTTGTISSDATLTITSTVTPPPTPSKSVSASVEVRSVASFLSYFNIFFMDSIAFDNCSWMVTYIVGPLLLLLLLHMIWTALWKWGCFPCCCTSEKASGSTSEPQEEEEHEVSIPRSLFAVTVYGSVLYPCHASCWVLHSQHLVIRIVLLLALFLFLVNWLHASPSLTATPSGAGSEESRSSIAVIIVGTLLSVQCLRPLYQWVTYTYTWSPEVMNDAWTELVNKDARYHQYLADSDDTASEGEEVVAEGGEVVPSELSGMRPVPWTKAEIDSSVGFAPLFEGEGNFDDISLGSEGSSQDDVAERMDIAPADASNIDDIIKLHMASPETDASTLYRSFRRDQDAHQNATLQKMKNSHPKRHRHRSKSSSARGASKEPELDIDVTDLIDTCAAGQSLPPLVSVREAQLKLQQESAAIEERTPTLVEQSLAHHLNGAALPDSDDDADDNITNGTIQDVARRRRRREVRRMQSAEAAVVDGLIQQHQQGMDLLRMDEELSQLPDVSVDFLIDEVVQAPESTDEATAMRNSKIRLKVKDILSSVGGVRGSRLPPLENQKNKKSEADLLIEAHLHGESLDALETVDQRYQRRLEELRQKQLEQEAQTNAEEKGVVTDLLASFEAGLGPTPLPDPQSEARSRLDVNLNDRTDVPTISSDAEIAVDMVLGKFAAEQELHGGHSKTAAQVEAESTVDGLLSAHLQPIVTEERTLIDDLMQTQLLTAEQETQRLRELHARETAEASEIDDLMSLHIDEGRQRKTRQDRSGKEVEELLTFFQDGTTELEELGGDKVRRKKSKKKKNKKKAEREGDDMVMPMIVVSDHEPHDPLRPALPTATHGVPPVRLHSDYSDDADGVMTLGSKANQSELLHTTSPFSSRRLALETPRSSPSATPRVQRHSSPDPSGPHTPNQYEKHFVANVVELLPDMDASTPQPKAEVRDRDSMPSNQIEEWTIHPRSYGSDEGEAEPLDPKRLLDADLLVQEDVAVTMQHVEDLDFDEVMDTTTTVVPIALLSPSARGLAADPASMSDRNFGLINSFVRSSDEESDVPGFSTTPLVTPRGENKKKKRKGTKKKTRHTPALDVPSSTTSSRPSSMPLPPAPPTFVDAGFRTLHAADASPGDELAHKASADEGSSNMPRRGSTLVSAKVLESLSGLGTNSLLEEDLEMLSLTSSMGAETKHTAGNLAIKGLATQTQTLPPVDDELSTETNSDVDHKFEKYCSVDVAYDASTAESDELYVPLPVIVHHGISAAVLCCILVLALVALYYVLRSIHTAPMCVDTIEWRFVILLIALDAFIMDPLAMIVTYGYRFILSNERNSIQRVLHPYDGERKFVRVPPLRAKYRSNQMHESDDDTLRDASSVSFANDEVRSVRFDAW